MDDTFVPERQITDIKLNQLKRVGYTGGKEIEDLMVELNKFKKAEGLQSDWWIDFKNKSTKQFVEAVYEELFNYLKKQ